MSEVVTEERIREVAKSLRRFFAQSWYVVPPPENAREEARRTDALTRGAHRSLVGALAYLMEHNPGVARALVLAGRDSAEQELRGETPVFVVRRSAAQRIPAWMVHPSVLATHRHVLQNLRLAWSAPVAPMPANDSRFVSRTGRFGPAQLVGTARHQAQVRQRTAAVIELFKTLASDAGIEKVPPSETAVRGWIVKGETRAQVSHRVVGALSGISPRRVKKMLDEAARYMRWAEEYGRILDLWGFSRAEDKSVNPPQSATQR